MNRIEVMELLGPLRNGAAILVGPGLAGYSVAAQGDHPLTLYNMDMAYVTAAALGVALGRPTLKVIAVEGDGSMLMGQPALTSVGRYAPSNLIVLVFDNGVYLTTGSGRATTATATGADIEAIGRAVGVRNSVTVSDLEESAVVLKRAFDEPGPWLIVAKVDKSDRQRSKEFDPYPIDCYESGQRFRRAALALDSATDQQAEQKP